MLLLAAPALATPPGRNGRLVYTTYKDETPDCGACDDVFVDHTLWAVRPDGTVWRRLGPGLAPSFAPGGGWLSYATKLERGGRLMLSRPDGSRRRQLSARSDGFASWSPRGDLLAFTRTSDRSISVYVVSRASGRARKLATTASTYDPGVSWSPGGKVLAYQGFNQIYTVRIDGSAHRRLINGHSPEWSKSGWIAFYQRPRMRGYRLLAIRADGSGLHEIAPPGPSSPVILFRWSPNGRRIAYQQRDGEIRIADVSGRITGRLATGEELTWFAWSPDGRRIAYYQGAGAIGIADTNGQITAQFATGQALTCCQLVWSPDGKLIAFVSGFGRVLNVVRSADGAPRAIATHRHINIASVVWQTLPR